MNRSGAQKKKPPRFPTLGGVAGQGGGVAVQGGVGVAGQGGAHSSEKWGLFMFWAPQGNIYDTVENASISLYFVLYFQVFSSI